MESSGDPALDTPTEGGNEPPLVGSGFESANSEMAVRRDNESFAVAFLFLEADEGEVGAFCSKSSLIQPTQKENKRENRTKHQNMEKTVERRNLSD
jgi:hypothetical protein